MVVQNIIVSLYCNQITITMKTFGVFILVSLIAYLSGYYTVALVVGYASLLALASELLTSFKINKK